MVCEINNTGKCWCFSKSSVIKFATVLAITYTLVIAAFATKMLIPEPNTCQFFVQVIEYNDGLPSVWYDGPFFSEEVSNRRATELFISKIGGVDSVATHVVQDCVK